MQIESTNKFNIVTLANAAREAVLKEVPAHLVAAWPSLVCADGFRMSVQASARHFSTPRVNGAEYYSHVEVAYATQNCALLAPYGGEDTDICENVPVEVVEAILLEHGGLDIRATVAFKRRMMN